MNDTGHFTVQEFGTVLARFEYEDDAEAYAFAETVKDPARRFWVFWGQHLQFVMSNGIRTRRR